MALPITSQSGYGSVTREDTDKVFKNVSQRFKNIGVPSSYINKSSIQKFEKGKHQTATKESPVGVLESLYRFIVQDTFKKTKDHKLENKKQEDIEKEQDEQQEELMTAVIEEKTVSEEKKEEGILSKLWRYFKYFQTGKFVYGHWEQIEKLLGIQGLGKTIKSISDDIGITGAFERIKSTVDDIVGRFGFGEESLYAPVKYEGDMGKILETIKKRESYGGNYKAQAKTTSASGAYQFIDTTWQSLAKEVPGASQYKRAKEAPPEIQDAVAALHVSKILKQSGGDVSKVPVAWYTGNIQGKMSAEGLAANKGLSVADYQRKWMEEYGSTSVKQVTTSPSTSIEQPTRLPRNNAAENEKGETGTTSSTKNIPSNDSSIAEDSDIRNLIFQKPEQRFILKIFAKKLQELRNELGYQKFIILSGYRSKEYNDELRKRHRGVAKNSCHTARIAADIVVAPSSEARVQFIRTASRLGFGGIGVYRSFIHVDLGKRRTWPTDFKPSQDIIDALNDHVNQTTPQKDYKPIPGTEYEDGESGINQMNEGVEEEAKSFDPIEDMNNYLQSGLNLMKKLTDSFNESSLHDFKNKLEDALNKFPDVPRREFNVPDLDAAGVQRNIRQNIINTTRIIAPVTDDVDDSPPSLRKR